MENVFGVDVAKNWVDVVGPEGHERVGNDDLLAFAGLAPMARDSGVRTGKRRVGGGRKSLRDVLYMAGLSAARSDPALRASSDRLRANGKAPKQAIIACVGRLIHWVNL